MTTTLWISMIIIVGDLSSSCLVCWVPYESKDPVIVCGFRIVCKHYLALRSFFIASAIDF